VHSHAAKVHTSRRLKNKTWNIQDSSIAQNLEFIRLSPLLKVALIIPSEENAPISRKK
jgi:hypothetical protein